MRLSISFLLFLPLLAAAQDQSVLAEGKAQYDKWCAICHGDENAWSGGGTQALRVLYQGALPAKLEDRTDLAPELIETLVRQGRFGMPNFRYTEISPAQLDAIVAYLRRNNAQ